MSLSICSGEKKLARCGHSTTPRECFARGTHETAAATIRFPSRTALKVRSGAARDEPSKPNQLENRKPARLGDHRAFEQAFGLLRSSWKQPGDKTENDRETRAQRDERPRFHRPKRNAARRLDNPTMR